MLAVVFGASGSGKTTQTRLVRDMLADVVVHDFDEGGESGPWDLEWRRRQTCHWLQKARAEAEAGRDLLLIGGAVPGEVLASEGAVDLDGLAFCLLDVEDEERARRIVEREAGSEQGVSPHQLWDHVAWGVWLRFHAADPAWWTGPIRGTDDGGLTWSRWDSWRGGDPRWRIARVDTTGVPPSETAHSLVSWLRARQHERDAGTLPLSGSWWET